MLRSQRPASAVSDEEDLYSGYNEYSTGYGTKALQADEILHQALLNTGKGSKRQPGAAMRFGTSSGYREGTSSYLRTTLGSRQMQGPDAVTRPMTAVRGAGYTSGESKQMFDPLNQGNKGPSPALERDETPEDKIRRFERHVMQLVEESCKAAVKADTRLALEKAKEASSRERALIRLQEQGGLGEAHNIDLTFSVLFNLAHQYENNAMYTEALNTYQAITRNRMFSNASRLKINMGNIYTRLGQLTRAIKLYRMALDQVPSAHKELRLKIMHNIGLLFVKMGQYNDACMSFEFIMQEKPDFKTGLHLVLCYSALGDIEKMQRGFRLLLEVPLDIDEEEKYTATPEDSGTNMQLEAIRNDALRRVEREMRQQAERSIVNAAKLVAKSSSQGFAWCVDVLKTSSYAGLAGELELNKALMYLKQRELQAAIDTLRVLSDTSKMSSAAATNLSFIYFQQQQHRSGGQGEVDDAEQWAEKAKATDSYNAGAFVNLGCCAYAKGEFEKARDLFLCALENDSSCVEALFNLGVTEGQKTICPLKWDLRQLTYGNSFSSKHFFFNVTIMVLALTLKGDLKRNIIFWHVLVVY
ncbi:hypothetical protein B566_EDAN007314 [Ephemera danica]|nr:hypothetical protein B566_EDAN007314 [Ephemera danica]